MRFNLKVHNYRGLREIDWSPSGVCALVGANGSGKSTLLDVLALLRDALEHGLARAFEDHGGIANARNLYASKDEAYDFQVCLRDIYWRVAPVEVGSGFRPQERVSLNNVTLVDREAGADDALLMGDPVPVRDVLALRVFMEELTRDKTKADVLKRSPFENVVALGQLLTRYRYYSQYDLRTLRRSGSSDSSERRLARDGGNVFSVLRNWRDKKDDRDRYAFVVDGLRQTFGDFFDDIDFAKTAQVVGAELHLRGNNVISASLAPDGWFVMLLHLTAIASTNVGDIIAIDEPENALHPHALNLFVELARQWSLQKDVTILLATHSPVVISAFRSCPEQLFVIEQRDMPMPMPVTELKEPGWLSHFSLGDLYVREEFGGPQNDDNNRIDHDR